MPLFRYNDNKEVNQAIKGIWACDVLEDGVMVDDSGKERHVKGNIMIRKSRK